MSSADGEILKNEKPDQRAVPNDLSNLRLVFLKGGQKTLVLGLCCLCLSMPWVAL